MTIPQCPPPKVREYLDSSQDFCESLKRNLRDDTDGRSPNRDFLSRSFTAIHQTRCLGTQTLGCMYSILYLAASRLNSSILPHPPGFLYHICGLLSYLSHRYWEEEAINTSWGGAPYIAIRHEHGQRHHFNTFCKNLTSSLAPSSSQSESRARKPVLLVKR